MTEKEIFNLKEAAEYLGLCTKSIRKMIKNHHIPILKYVRDIRIKKRDLDRLFEYETTEH